jgi:hypothetical protein
MSEIIHGGVAIEGVGTIHWVEHEDGQHSWRASNLAGEVTNRSGMFANQEDPINDVTRIIAKEGNPFKP